MFRGYFDRQTETAFPVGGKGKNPSRHAFLSRSTFIILEVLMEAGEILLVDTESILAMA
jgi:hypothetical protein